MREKRTGVYFLLQECMHRGVRQDNLIQFSNIRSGLK
jgi:hypothetical protein